MKLESNDDIDHPYVYIGRAELNFRKENFDLALEDLNKALISQKLTNAEKYNATLLRIATKSYFDILEVDDIDIQYVIQSNEVGIEQTENYLIIRNLPNSFQSEQLPFLFTDTGVCVKPSDVKILNSGTFIIKKRSIEEDRPYCNYCARVTQSARVEQRTIEGCKNWCDVHSINGQLWCGKFQDIRCKAACHTALLLAQKTCHWCCNDGAFYDKCVAPFADLLSLMPSKCDPEWD